MLTPSTTTPVSAADIAEIDLSGLTSKYIVVGDHHAHPGRQWKMGSDTLPIARSQAQNYKNPVIYRRESDGTWTAIPSK